MDLFQSARPPADALLNFITIRKKLYHFLGFFPKLGFSMGFPLFIINIARRISAATVSRGRTNAPVLRVNEPKNTGARSARSVSAARTN
jgi:hypothetical protein